MASLMRMAARPNALGGDTARRFHRRVRRPGRGWGSSKAPLFELARVNATPSGASVHSRRRNWPSPKERTVSRQTTMQKHALYSGPVFEMARRQFDGVADHLEIADDERDRLLLPKRAIAVSCPIHRDDGTTAAFQGYRVQHHLTLGPPRAVRVLRCRWTSGRSPRWRFFSFVAVKFLSRVFTALNLLPSAFGTEARERFRSMANVDRASAAESVLEQGVVMRSETLTADIGARRF